MGTPQKSSGSRRAATMEELLRQTKTQILGLSKGQEVEGRVIEKTSKTLVLDIGAKSEGIVTNREFDLARYFIKTLKPDDKVKARVVVPENKEGQTLLSLQDQAQEFAWKAINNAYHKAEEVEVQIEAATRVGLVANFYGVKGFIPHSQLSSNLEANPQATIGQTLRVRIIECDKDRNRVVLSEKAITEKDAIKKQESVIKIIKVGERFKGRVTKIVNFGAFVTIEKDGIPIDGLVHLSEISWQTVSDPRQVLAEGSEVEVVVIGKDLGASGHPSRLALSIKKTQKDPWEGVEKKYKKESQVKGRITKIGDFGAIVELEPGVEALLPLTKTPTDISLSEGQIMNFFIENIDEERRKITLTLSLTKKPLVYK